MSLFLPNRVVVFDYGEVISRTPRSAKQELVALTGVPEAELLPLYEQHRHALDAGDITVVEYWRTIGDAVGKRWSVAEIQVFWATDFTGWFTMEPGTLRVIEDLHDAGTRLALLSNAGLDFGDPYRHSPIGSLFELVVTSAEEHALKPGPEIYESTCRQLGIEPSQMVFIDNRAENARGAEAIGAVGHHFTSPAELRAFLEGLS